MLPTDAGGNVLPGYTGEGYDLQGIWEIGELISSLNPDGEVNQSRGHSVKVGVVEHSAFVAWDDSPANSYEFTHEDLAGKVQPEPGQDIIIIRGLPNDPMHPLGGHHGTGEDSIVVNICMRENVLS